MVQCHPKGSIRSSGVRSSTVFGVRLRGCDIYRMRGYLFPHGLVLALVSDVYGVSSACSVVFSVGRSHCLWAVLQHGALVSPPARNAFDRTLPEFRGGRGSLCSCGNASAGCTAGDDRAGMGGQPCLWFSQGMLRWVWTSLASDN